MLILSVILWSAFYFVPQVHAATTTITSCPTGTGLHNVVNSASSGDTIRFRISGSPCTIDLSGADGGGTLVINKNLAFDASGSSQPVTISGGDAVQVLQVSAGATFALNTLTIAQGSGGFFSSGIVSDGTMTISNSIFANNAAISGGGIENRGTMTISNSTFTNNNKPDSTGERVKRLLYQLQHYIPL